MPFEDGPEQYDFRERDDPEEGLPGHVVDIIEHLRATLTYDRAVQAIRNRFQTEPESDAHLERLIEELISEAFNDGYDDWDDFPY